MGIEDYEFEVFNPVTLEHLKRHLRGTTMGGSVFFKKRFPTPESLANFALQFIGDYNGKRIERMVDLPYIIGYDGVVALDRLPRSAVVRKELRDDELVNVVYGVSRRKTNRMVIIAGPTEEGKHSFITIHPGEYYPPLSDKAFWKKHALIVSYKNLSYR